MKKCGSVAILTLCFFVSQARASTYAFQFNLAMGSSGPEVTALQTFLINNSYLIMPSGTTMGYFGPITRAALAVYQNIHGITPAVGYFGPITRDNINALGTVGLRTQGMPFISSVTFPSFGSSTMLVELNGNGFIASSIVDVTLISSSFVGVKYPQSAQGIHPLSVTNSSLEFAFPSYNGGAPPGEYVVQVINGSIRGAEMASTSNAFKFALAPPVY